MQKFRQINDQWIGLRGVIGAEMLGSYGEVTESKKMQEDFAEAEEMGINVSSRKLITLVHVIEGRLREKKPFG